MIWLKRARKALSNLPLVGLVVPKAQRPLGAPSFNSNMYWETRYAHGGNSGAGSYGNLAEFKAEVLNAFVKENKIHSVIEFGCGDGNQLSLAKYHSYVGLDVSKTAITLCKERFKHDQTKSFFFYDPEFFVDRAFGLGAELSLSLDVIYHLREDKIFESHLRHLFSAAQRFVIIYSTNYNHDALEGALHVKHREFSAWVQQNLPGWTMLRRVPNRFRCSSMAEFFIYGKHESGFPQAWAPNRTLS